MTTQTTSYGTTKAGRGGAAILPDDENDSSGPGPEVMDAATPKGDNVVNAAGDDLGKIESRRSCSMSCRDGSPMRRTVVRRGIRNGREALCDSSGPRSSSTRPRSASVLDISKENDWRARQIRQGPLALDGGSKVGNRDPRVLQRHALLGR